MRLSVRRAGLALVAGSLAVSFAAAGPALADPGSAAKKAKQVDVQLLAFNDFHGALQADPTHTLSESLDPSQTPVGGVEYLASTLESLRQHAPDGNTLTVAAGDIIGGSTFLSGLFHDEPSIEAMDALGLDVSSVGNHEFDEGTTELLRMQNGGCHPVDGCYFPNDPYDGADFDYLAANVVNKDDGSTLLPPYEIRTVDGVKIGFIGLTTKTTPALVSPSGVASVDFLDEVQTINHYVIQLKRHRVRSIVVLMHEGGYQTGTYDGCQGISGVVVDIAKRLHPEVDALVTGHTHQPYVCELPSRGGPLLTTSAASSGDVATEISLRINKRSRDVVSASAVNHLVTHTIAPDPVQTAIIDKWNAIAGPIGGRVVGTVAEDITGDKDTDRAHETPMGDLLADAILWGTSGENGGAQIAFMNIGGVRDEFIVDQISAGEQPGEITYQEAYNVAPFGNLLVSMDLTGQQIKDVLEQQYQPIEERGSRAMLALGVSEGFSYEWDDSRPEGDRVVPGSMTLNGEPIELDQTYRVGTLNFLADGGDSFTAFGAGTNLLGGAEDLANLVDYLGAHPGLTAPPDRVSGL